MTHELARELTELSREIGRQVGVLVDRRGAVTHVMAGDAGSIVMPDWGRMRAGLGRLRGVRCLHTTLGGEPLTRDDLTDLAKLRLDAMATIEVARGRPARPRPHRGALAGQHAATAASSASRRPCPRSSSSTSRAGSARSRTSWRARARCAPSTPSSARSWS